MGARIALSARTRLNRAFLIVVGLAFVGFWVWSILQSSQRNGPFILIATVGAAVLIAFGLGAAFGLQHRVQAVNLARTFPDDIRFSIANDSATRLGIDLVARDLRLQDVEIGTYSALSIVASSESIKIFKGGRHPELVCAYPSRKVSDIVIQNVATFVGTRSVLAVSFQKAPGKVPLLLTPVSHTLGYPFASKPASVDDIAGKFGRTVVATEN